MKKILFVVAVIFYISLQFVSAESKLEYNNMLSQKKANPVLNPLKNSGSDSWGYSWIDNSEPGLTYTWQEISATGTNLVPGIDEDDEYFGPFNIGFSFPFYGYQYTQFYFGTNGTIYFQDGYLGLGYVEIPGDPNYSGITRFIAWHWCDLEMLASNNAAVYYQNFGTYAIIQFQNYNDFDEDNLGTMQVVLYNSGDIELRYNTIATGSYDYTNYFAVGIQDSPTKGMEIAYDNSTFFSSGKSIYITNTMNAVPVSKYAILAMFLLVGVVISIRFFRR